MREMAMGYAGLLQPTYNVNNLMHSLFARYAEMPIEQALAVTFEFPDVSFYQGVINWDVFAERSKAVIIRAGQQTWVDNKFKINWIEAKKRSIKRGLYWFYDGRSSPQAQAKILMDLIRYDLPEMEIWIDWELDYKGDHEGVRNVVAMMQLMEAFLAEMNSDVEVGLYSGYYFVAANTNLLLHGPQLKYLATKPFWLAQYGVSTNSLKIPYPYKTVRHHQYGTPTIGPTFGVQSKEIDMNRFADPHLTPDELYGPGIPPVIHDEDDMDETLVTPEWRKVIATMLNIRNSPGATDSASDVGDLPQNSLVKVDKYARVGTSVWYHLVDAVSPQNNLIKTTDGRTVRERTDLWAAGQYLIASSGPVFEPVPVPDSTTAKPPQELLFRDNNGVLWKCTSFEKVS